MILCDIDGTLANINHRLHHVKNGNTNWDAFFAGIKDDIPIESTISILNKFASDYEIILVTGRPEEYRQATLDWLTDNVIPFHALWMRPSKDYRPDHVVKKDLLAKIKKCYGEFRIDFVIDDRPSVVEMWRNEGLVCYQINPDSWESYQPLAKGAKLVLLVGPSHAGKSSYVYDLHMTEGANLVFIVNSDGVRELITGSRDDQTKNDQVFKYIHDLVKLNLNSGISTVVDATNLHARDRKQFLNIAHADTPIEYWVFDRPLEQKLASIRSGFPEHVIHKHHKSFHSGLSHILAGDNDPRVTVKDFRNVS